MLTPFAKSILSGIILLVLVSTGVWYFFLREEETSPPPPVVQEEVPLRVEETIGISVEGRDIDAYTYGSGPTKLVFVGGMHGGYEWNSVLLAYRFVDYLDATPEAVPSDLTVTIIPSINPDGIYTTIGKEGRFVSTDVPASAEAAVAGRFNASNVDLNRNFDCKWQAESTWRSEPVSAGTASFSEPETAALRDFVLSDTPAAVIFWHSQSGAVYGSECEEGILPVTTDIMNAYARAAGYGAVPKFDAYPITGDAEGWLASIGIPAITVELTTHEAIEWDKNLAGVKALFTYFQQ